MTDVEAEDLEIEESVSARIREKATFQSPKVPRDCYHLLAQALVLRCHMQDYDFKVRRL